LNATETIRLFYKQVELHNGLPVSLEIPNEVTARTLDATDVGRDVVACEDAEDLFSKLGI
jgi:DNA-damage-inducible protein J